MTKDISDMVAQNQDQIKNIKVQMAGQQAQKKEIIGAIVGLKKSIEDAEKKREEEREQEEAEKKKKEEEAAAELEAAKKALDEKEE